MDIGLHVTKYNTNFKFTEIDASTYGFELCHRSPCIDEHRIIYAFHVSFVQYLLTRLVCSDATILLEADELTFHESCMSLEIGNQS